MKNYFFIKTDGKYIRIHIQDILYAEGARNYTKIITETKQYIVLLTMKKLEEFLPASLFKRIHKSFIVSIDKIYEFDTEKVKLGNVELPIGYLYRTELEKSMPIINDKTGNSKAGKDYYKMSLLNKENQKDKLIVAG